GAARPVRVRSRRNNRGNRSQPGAGAPAGPGCVGGGCADREGPAAASTHLMFHVKQINQYADASRETLVLHQPGYTPVEGGRDEPSSPAANSAILKSISGCTPSLS